MKKQFTKEDAVDLIELLNIDLESSHFDINQFLMGINVELEHGIINEETNVTNDDKIMTGKIALAHLREFPDYYTRLEKLEKEAEAYWNR